MKKPIKIGEQWFSKVGEGFQLELFGQDEDGNKLTKLEYPLMSFYKVNEANELLVELFTPNGPVSIAVEDLKNAIKHAEKDVHSEEFYD